MFIMSILFILLMIAAPAITDAQLNTIDWSLKTFMPKFDIKLLYKYFNFSICSWWM